MQFRVSAAPYKDVEICAKHLLKHLQTVIYYVI